MSGSGEKSKRDVGAFPFDVVNSSQEDLRTSDSGTQVQIVIQSSSRPHWTRSCKPIRVAEEDGLLLHVMAIIESSIVNRPEGLTSEEAASRLRQSGPNVLPLRRALDIGTDILPALALGTEPPSPGVLERPSHGRHLLDVRLLVRAFGILGPVEALIEMVAFLVSMAAAGWRPGMAFPDGAVFLAASGAAFSAVVIGQMANAFACRSATRWPGAVGWTTNRPLVYAVIAELLLLPFFLFVRPVAAVLGQAPPSSAGAAFAILAFPVALCGCAIQIHSS